MFVTKQDIINLQQYVDSADKDLGKLISIVQRNIDYPPLETDNAKWSVQKSRDLAETKELLHPLIKELGYEVKDPEVKGRSLVKVKK